MSGCHVNIYPSGDDQIEWHHRSANLTNSLTIHLPGDDTEAAAWCRTLAASLWARADEMEVDVRYGKRLLAGAIEQVTALRRERGELAPDGWCWECKGDNHEQHKDYMGGACYGCACPAGTDDKASR